MYVVVFTTIIFFE